MTILSGGLFNFPKFMRPKITSGLQSCPIVKYFTGRFSFISATSYHSLQNENQPQQRKLLSSRTGILLVNLLCRRPRYSIPQIPFLASYSE
jgi:hypothetical protein